MVDAFLTYAAVLAVLMGVDLLWIGLIALDFYKRQLGPAMRDRPSLAVATLFYILYAVGVTLLAVQPALAGGGWTRAAGLGAVLGLCAYGAYDLTNLATLRQWSWRLAIVDMLWGTALTATAAVAGFVIGGLDLFAGR